MTFTKKPVTRKVAVVAPTKKAAPAVAAPAKKGFPARKPGIVAAKKTVRKPLPSFKAPADFKPHFLLLQVTTEADGLFASKIKAVRYQGKFSFDADDKKKFDMANYDMSTVVGIAARLGGVTYKATNDKKYPLLPTKRVGFKGAARLPAKASFQVLIRVGKKAADNSLTAGVKQVWQGVKSEATGRIKRVELLKTDVCYRAIRKSSRMLPAAFANVQMPPKRTRGKRVEEAEE